MAEKALTAVIQEAYVQGVSPARSTISSGRWAALASPRAKCRGCAKRSTNGSRPSSISARRRLALRSARRDLREGPPQPSHRVRRGDRRRWGQHRRPARGARHGIAPRRPRRSGPSFCASSAAGACAASSSSCPTPMRGSRRRSPS